jgi:hypothetical protein
VLSVNSIFLDIVRSRVKQGNPDAYNQSQQSPIKELEAIICELCIQLRKIDKPLTKTTVMELANGIVLDTVYQSEFAECKELRRQIKTETLGEAWKHDFMHHFQDALTQNGSTVKDIKRRTWVTRENFENTYETMYATMVKPGITEEVESRGSNPG